MQKIEHYFQMGKLTQHMLPINRAAIKIKQSKVKQKLRRYIFHKEGSARLYKISKSCMYNTPIYVFTFPVGVAFGKQAAMLKWGPRTILIVSLFY